MHLDGGLIEVNWNKSNNLRSVGEVVAEVVEVVDEVVDEVVEEVV